MALGKTDARRLANKAQEMGAITFRGSLVAEGGKIYIGNADILPWLQGHSGQEVLLLAAEISSDEEEIRTCSICGNDFRGFECPRCSDARSRLRLA